MFKRVAFNGLAVLGLLAGTSAYAEQAPAFYVGAGVGQSNIKIDGVGFDGSDTAFKVFGGYSFNEYFAVEATYFDGGAPDDTVRFFNVPVTLETEVTGLNASAVGSLPLGDMFSLFAKVGFISYDVEITGSSGGFSSSEDGSDSDVSYGVGGVLSFGQFALRAEYEAFDISGGDFNFLSISGQFKF